MEEPFHAYFGFRNRGIDERVLSRLDHGFLKAVVQGRSIPGDPRLFLQLNPDQILGVMAGYYLIARRGNDELLSKSVPNMYARLLMEGRELFGSQLNSVNDSSVVKNVRPYSNDDASITTRLIGVLDRDPELQGIISAQCVDATRRYQFEKRMDGEWDPNSPIKARYSRPIVDHFRSMYDRFRASKKFLSETQAAIDRAHKKS